MMTRRISSTIHVDFKPIVSVALLLIVFFIWLKAVKKPKIIGVTVPKECRKLEGKHAPKKIITFFLLANDQIGVMQYWNGDDMVELNLIDSEKDNVPNQLADWKKGADGDMTVTVKPTQRATFQNVATILNALREADIPYSSLETLPGIDQRRISYYEQQFIHHRIGRETLFLQMEPYYRAAGE